MSQKQAQLLNPINGNLNISGVVTATSFAGSGEGLTGVASTDNIQTATEATFLSGVKITGVTTASGGVVGNVTGNATGLSGSPNINVGSITASSGSVSGNLSIGGTITYQDVTNMDVLGIGTFQQGIQILANGANIVGIVTVGVTTIKSGEIEVTGVVTATSFQGDGSQLSGVESGIGNFVASGTIPNGSTVIIKTDGTVSTITQTTVDPTAGSEVVFNSGSTEYTSCAYDSNSQKVVIAYRDLGNSNYGTAIVGTVSGTSISFGSESVFKSGAVQWTRVAYDSNSQKVVIGYRNAGGSGEGKAIVGTVSGTSISFGSEVEFNSGNTDYILPTFDSSNNKVVIAYRDRGNSNYGTAIVGTVSGTSISFGSEVVFESANSWHISSTFDSSNNKVVIAYNDVGNSQYGTAIVGTVSGTSISFGTPVVYNDNGATNYNTATFDSTNGKVVIAYQDGGNSYDATAIVGTVSGTSISFGTPVVFYTGSNSYTEATYDSNNDKVVIAYQDASNSNYGTAITGTVSGTSISFGNAVVLNDSGETYWFGLAYDANSQKVVITYRDGGNSNYGTAVVFNSFSSQTTDLTTENYIGIAAEAISDTATGKINILGGVNSGQTGLTTAKTYYVQPTGTLATTAGDPSVVAGTSISSTKIIVRKS